MGRAPSTVGTLGREPLRSPDVVVRAAVQQTKGSPSVPSPLRPITALSAALLVLLTSCAAPPTTPESALPLTPPMGWNSWNSGIDLTEQNIEGTIDAMVSSGMRAAGYRYVNLD
ncbi:MAG: alpha-galactosidase, partial [Mycobacterium sp.]|nr:alpha-galactosidase [Mycobacterium sp.]